jgi:hypothetical protein
MKTIKLENGKVVTVTKLPLKKYVELLKGLQELPKHLSGMEGLTNQELFAKLPDIIADALPDVVRILSIASDLKEDEINELPLDEVIEVFMSIIEENKFAQVYDRLKKATAQPAAVVKK